MDFILFQFQTKTFPIEEGASSYDNLMPFLYTPLIPFLALHLQG